MTLTKTRVIVFPITILALAILMVLSACDIPEFDPPNRLKHDRVLAIRTVPRMPQPGDTVSVDALVVQQDGRVYTGPITWVVTGSIGFSTGADGEDLPQGNVFVQVPDGPRFTITIPKDPDEFEALYGIPYSGDGTALTVGMSAGDPNDPNALIALKSMIVTDNPDKENPVFHDIRVLSDGQEVAPEPTGVTVVGNVATVKLIADADFPTRGNNVTFHWFTTTEGIEYSTDKAVEWKLPKKAGYYHVYCVVRENSPTIIDNGLTRITSAGIDWADAVIQITSGF